MSGFRSKLRLPFFIRLFNWEYWSFQAIYTPIYFIWFGLSLRAKSFFFFAAANPRIKNGGFLSESKREICPLIPAELHPRTVFFSYPADPGQVLIELGRKNLNFPLIGKPDIGARGRGVEMLRDESEVINYAKRALVNFHVQEFVPYENEVGIFYYKLPGEKSGHISGIVRKEFLKVKGDGVSTVRDLMSGSQRALLQIKVLERNSGSLLERIPGDGEEMVVVPYGNHARGAKFVDDTLLADEELTQTMDNICSRIPEFYFGRLDIRYKCWADLKNGTNFSIIEVNGAGSEPTHIYDPRHSLFFAWREIVRHLILLWRISRRNRKRGYPYLSVREGIRMLAEDRRNSKRLAAMNR